MKRRLLIFVLLLLLVACGKKAEPPTESTPKAANAAAAPCDGCYTLKIVFHGLMGFAHDPQEGKFWAFLVKTVNDPDRPSPGDFPLGVLDDPRSKSPAFLQSNFPQHFAKIRISDAEVTGCDTPEPGKGCDISGADITFSNGVTGLAVDLAKMSDSSFIPKTRKIEETAQKDLEKLDQLDPALIAPLQGKLDPRLAVRVLISAGDVVANLFSCNGQPRTFSYNMPSEDPEVCTQKPENAVPLAEEVVVTQSNVETPTTIDLGPLGKTITLKPKEGVKTVTVEIVNQTADANDAADPCQLIDPSHFHGAAFRWLYTLAQGNISFKNHFFPCLVQHSHGGDKCPPKEFVIKGH
jgi:hypothetical protein